MNLINIIILLLFSLLTVCFCFCLLLSSIVYCLEYASFVSQCLEDTTHVCITTHSSLDYIYNIDSIILFVCVLLLFTTYVQ